MTEYKHCFSMQNFISDTNHIGIDVSVQCVHISNVIH